MFIITHLIIISNNHNNILIDKNLNMIAIYNRIIHIYDNSNYIIYNISIYNIKQY